MLLKEVLTAEYNTSNCHQNEQRPRQLTQSIMNHFEKRPSVCGASEARAESERERERERGDRKRNQEEGEGKEVCTYGCTVCWVQRGNEHGKKKQLGRDLSCLLSLGRRQRRLCPMDAVSSLGEFGLSCEDTAWGANCKV